LRHAGNGVVAAARDLGIKVPIVIRMEGTNVEQGARFSRFGFNFTSPTA
jgi:succinyl-CoA synthetase beta subunit